MHFYQNWEQEMSFTISQATEIDMEFCEQFEILSGSNFKKMPQMLTSRRIDPELKIFSSHFQQKTTEMPEIIIIIKPLRKTGTSVSSYVILAGFELN